MATSTQRSRNGTGQRQEEEPGFGTLFDRRQTRQNPKAPDFSTGERYIVLDDGTELEAAIWLKPARDGKQATVRVHVQRPYVGPTDDDPSDEDDGFADF